METACGVFTKLLNYMDLFKICNVHAANDMLMPSIATEIMDKV